MQRMMSVFVHGLTDWSRVMQQRMTTRTRAIGYWLIAILTNELPVISTISSAVALWNDQILTDRRRYSSSAMFIRAEVVSYETILKQQLRDDPRVWPRPLAKPDPR